MTFLTTMFLNLYFVVQSNALFSNNDTDIDFSSQPILFLTL